MLTSEMQQAAGIATLCPRLPFFIYLVLQWPPAPSYRTLPRAPAQCMNYQVPSSPDAPAEVGRPVFGLRDPHLRREDGAAHPHGVVQESPFVLADTDTL